MLTLYSQAWGYPFVAVNLLEATLLQSISPSPRSHTLSILPQGRGLTRLSSFHVRILIGSILCWQPNKVFCFWKLSYGALAGLELVTRWGRTCTHRDHLYSQRSIQPVTASWVVELKASAGPFLYKVRDTKRAQQIQWMEHCGSAC